MGGISSRRWSRIKLYVPNIQYGMVWYRIGVGWLTLKFKQLKQLPSNNKPLILNRLSQKVITRILEYKIILECGF